MEISFPRSIHLTILLAHWIRGKRVKFEKIPNLRPAFAKDGTITAANSSSISDGASALVLMSEDQAKAEGFEPLGYIKSYAFAALDPRGQMLMGPSYATPIVIDVEEGNSFLPRLWARRHIDALLAEGVRGAVAREVVEYSRRFGIITPLVFKLSEKETTIGPHIPIQCPKPTIKPVVRNVRYKVSIDDIENKLRGSHVRDSDRRFPNSFSAGTSHNGAGSGINTFSVGFE